MSGSMLIYGGTKEERFNKALELSTKALKAVGKRLDSEKFLKESDVKIIENEEGKKSIGIAQTKGGIKFLQERPFSLRQKILIITEAQLLTDEAQNSLLKTLEEPPEYATIILNAKTENSLLSTIVSRCRKFPAGDLKEANHNEDSETDLEDIVNMENWKRIETAGEIAKYEKEDLIKLLEDWASKQRKELSKSSVAARNIKKILEVKKDLEDTNVNARLAIETLLLSLY
jgi:DNA polymerase III subunit delta'